ncbi:MAG TPA: hypothetical protein VGG72_12405 [Bryobacteraceae bacterium]|jgi:hypothetical protein
MLTKSQAREIVRGSIEKAAGDKKAVEPDNTLGELISPKKIQDLAITIVSDPKVGVPRLQHYLDPNQLADLQPDTTIADLTEKVFSLSAGKLCSNPNNPHPQKCCPYPATCPECGYQVR